MLWVSILFVLGLGGCEVPHATRFVTKIDWMEHGQWIKADTHIHTRFSDGSHGLDEIALQAKAFGCDVIAITDHADRNLSAATPEYAEAILAARRSHPDLMILSGLEWNVPPWGGDEHATVLVPPGPDEFLTLAEFKQKFDDLGRETHQSERALAAFAWLSQAGKAWDVPPLIFLNHPSRKVDQSQEISLYFGQWRNHSNLAAGFSGAPGHQKTEGSYKGKVALIDRWDPAAAEVGGVWDQLLARGEDVWAARAPSDFHSLQMDFWPGEFSETWLYVPTRTPEGVLKAFKAGSFFAGHGHIARNVELQIHAEGLPRPAYAGETIALATGSNLTVELKLEIPPTDWEGQPNQIDQIELIAVTPQGGARVIERQPYVPGQSFIRKFKELRAGFVVRARGRRIVPDGPDLMFYTNPIRIVTEDQSLLEKAWKGVAAWISWRRLCGAGLSLLLVAALFVGIRQRLDAREDLPADPPASPLNLFPPGTPPRRLHVFLAALGFLLLAVYGSLVPLNLRQVTFHQAWQYFWYTQHWGEIDFSNRSDWGANVLLYVPISFCWLGVFCLDRKNRLWKSLSTLFVWGGCLASSLVIEFLQSWVDARVPSHNDVYAQGVGTLIGTVFWFGFGQTFTNWWRLHTSQHNRHRLLAAVLSIYVLGFLTYSLIPLDFITHPGELYRKYQDGRIVLTLDWRSGLSKETIWRLTSDVLTFIPVGIWSALIWRDDNRRRSWICSLLIGGCVALVIETTQVFLLSRFAEVSDLLVGLLGVGIGSGGVSYLQSKQTAVSPSSDRSLIRTLGWLSGAILYSGFLVCFFCWPLHVVNDPARIHKAWSHFFHAAHDGALLVHRI